VRSAAHRARRVHGTVGLHPRQSHSARTARRFRPVRAQNRDCIATLYAECAERTKYEPDPLRTASSQLIHL
jgi:hypothetical protein